MMRILWLIKIFNKVSSNCCINYIKDYSTLLQDILIAKTNHNTQCIGSSERINYLRYESIYCSLRGDLTDCCVNIPVVPLPVVLVWLGLCPKLAVLHLSPVSLVCLHVHNNSTLWSLCPSLCSTFMSMLHKKLQDSYNVFGMTFWKCLHLQFCEWSWVVKVYQFY